MAAHAAPEEGVPVGVLLGVPDEATAGRVVALLEESATLRSAGLARTSPQVRAALDHALPDVVLLHEDLGPLPVLELLREIAARHPQVPVVVLAREPRPQLVRSTMEAGARGIVTLPASLEELHSRLETAAAWSRGLRSRFAQEADDGGPRAGRVLAVAGGKGGTGTTTVATLLALAVSGAGRDRVCLVDLDLQTGDVANQLGLLPRRSIADLVGVADELSMQVMEDTLFTHASGLRILLAPAEGELGEDATGEVARQVLGALRSWFDLVVVDCGSITTEATVAAIEIADQVVMTVTPDIPCLRGARRLLRLWTRLEACKPDDVTLVVNRASRNSEVQPPLVESVAGASVARSTLPARFRKLEPHLNSGPADPPSRNPLWTPVTRLARELDLLPAATSRRRSWSPRRPASASARPAAPAAQSSDPPPAAGRPDASAAAVAAADAAGPLGTVTPSAGTTAGDAGSGPVGFLIGFTTTATLFVLLLQGVLIALTGVLAGNAANAAAREVAVGGPAAATGLAHLPGPWQRDATFAVDGSVVTARLHVPAVFGLAGAVGLPEHVSASAGTELEPR